MLVVPHKRVPRAAEILPWILRALRNRRHRRKRLRQRKRPVGGELARQELGRARGVLQPAARHLAAQRWYLVAPARLQHFEWLVEAPDRVQFGPLPLRVPFFEEVRLDARGELVVGVVREQPHVVRVARVHLRELARHDLLHLVQRKDVAPARRPYPERRATLVVLRAAPYEHAPPAVRALPPEHHRERRIVAHVDAVAAAAGVWVPLPAHLRLVAPPDGGRMRIPLVRAEEHILHPRLGVWPNDAPGHPRVVRHEHGLRPDAPARLKLALRVDAAAELLEAVEMRVVAGARYAHVDAAAGHLVRDDRARLVLAPVLRIVAPEPRPLRDVAERRRVGVVGVGGDES